MSSITACSATHATLPLAPRVRPWLHRTLAAALRMLQAVAAWGFPVQAAPEELDLYSLAYLSDATLKDIGAPDGLRAYAAQQREQAGLLRWVETHRGGVEVSRW